MQAVLLMQGVVINDPLTQITAVFVTIGEGQAMEAARALKQQGIIEDNRFWPTPDMAQGMRVEHYRLVQLGWVYDGFGGYRKKTASSHPGPKLAASNVQVNGRFRPSNQLSLFVFAGGFDAPGGAV